jgi:hypothetical protein
MQLIATVNNIAGFEHEVVAWGKDHPRAAEIRAAQRRALKELWLDEAERADADESFLNALSAAISLLNNIASVRANPIGGSVDSAANREE